MSPSPSTAVPSVTTATVFCLIVRFQTLLRILGDRQADARDARRVGHREVVARLQRRLRDHLDLAAEVQQEGPVGDVLDLDAGQRLHGGDDLLDVVGARRVDRDVAHLLALLDADEVDRAEAPARVADHAGDVGEGTRTVVQMHAERGAEGRRRMGVAHGAIVAEAPAAASVAADPRRRPDHERAGAAAGRSQRTSCSELARREARCSRSSDGRARRG